VEVPEAVRSACQAIIDKKGLNVVALDVRGISTMTDYFIIAEGTVPRHVSALAQNVDDVLRKNRLTPSHVEGLSEGEWVVLDYMDFILHLFTPELRGYYALEEIWKQGKVMKVPLEYGRQSQGNL
jgi:ribosome-associated protein